tara:strand:- start:10092 stop:10424 length:333 start_codon:yes stop_codon:yes gene_type:complete
MMTIVSAVLAAAVVALVLFVAVFDHRCPVPRRQRIGLCLMAAGLTWAGPARLLGWAPGPGDLMFMMGLLILLLALYGQGLVRRVDALDGKVDGQLNVVPLHRGVARPPRS